MLLSMLLCCLVVSARGFLLDTTPSGLSLEETVSQLNAQLAGLTTKVQDLEQTVQNLTTLSLENARCLVASVPESGQCLAEQSYKDLKWWQKSIVYQIYPRSFQDSNGDGTGDIQGIISRLPYLQDLGIGVIWLNPFYKSPMKDFGYDISDYKDVDPLFGTLKDFDELTQVAHNHSLRVIVDFVPNHCSDQNVWFQLSRNRTGKYADYFMWEDGKVLANGTRVPPNNWQSVFGGSAWEWDAVRQQYYYHAFLKSQIDFNYHNPDVLTEMDNVLKFWLDRGVDGFRIGAIPHMFETTNLSLEIQPNDDDKIGYRFTKNQPGIFDVVRRWRKVLDEYERKDGEARWMVSETAGISTWDRLKYYAAGSTPFFFDLMDAITVCRTHVTVKCIMDPINKGVKLINGEWPNFVLGNHDNNRISDRIGPEFVDAANMLLLTLPGTPTTYYGEEIGLKDGDYTGMTPKDPNQNANRDPERNPMQWNTSANAGFTSGTPWLPVTAKTDYQNVNVEVESKISNSTLMIYKTLAKLRKSPAFLNKDIQILPLDDEDMIAFIRSDGIEKYLVVIQIGGDAAEGLPVVAHKSGYVVVATGGAFDRLHTTIDLGNIQLKKGDGLVIHVLN